jgi:hypothetical protein
VVIAIKSTSDTSASVRTFHLEGEREREKEREREREIATRTSNLTTLTML